MRYEILHLKDFFPALGENGRDATLAAYLPDNLTEMGRDLSLIHICSGCDISSISITPSTSTEWDTEYVDGVFADGESIEAGLGTYKESEVPDTYNILVYNGENYILYDTSVDELDIELHDGDYIVFLPPEGEVPFDVVSDYDPSAYDTEDEWIEEPDYTIDETADIAPYAGCWKFDTEPRCV